MVMFFLVYIKPSHPCSAACVVFVSTNSVSTIIQALIQDFYEGVSVRMRDPGKGKLIQWLRTVTLAG